MRALIEELAASALTPTQLREWAEHTNAFLASEFGHRLSDEEAGALRKKMRRAHSTLVNRRRGPAA